MDGIQKERVVPVRQIYFDVVRRTTGVSGHLEELGALVGRIEPVRREARQEIGGFAAFETCQLEIVDRPRQDQHAVCVEAARELVPLMAEVAFDLELHT